MNDILDDLNSWQARDIGSKRARSQEWISTSLRVAIDEITCHAPVPAKGASS